MANGRVYTLGAQTEHSLKKILKGDSFWGAGWDVRLTLYGMFNFIDSPDPDVDDTYKIKFGADLFYSALPWLAAAVRFDRLSMVWVVLSGAPDPDPEAERKDEPPRARGLGPLH